MEKLSKRGYFARGFVAWLLMLMGCLIGGIAYAAFMPAVGVQFRAVEGRLKAKFGAVFLPKLVQIDGAAGQIDWCWSCVLIQRDTCLNAPFENALLWENRSPEMFRFLSRRIFKSEGAIIVHITWPRSRTDFIQISPNSGCKGILVKSNARANVFDVDPYDKCYLLGVRVRDCFHFCGCRFLDCVSLNPRSLTVLKSDRLQSILTFNFAVHFAVDDGVGKHNNNPQKFQSEGDASLAAEVSPPMPNQIEEPAHSWFISTTELAAILIGVCLIGIGFLEIAACLSGGQFLFGLVAFAIGLLIFGYGFSAFIG
jgi:hypothetical protein